MPKFFVADDNIEENKIKLDGENVNHIKNVLRKKIGDELVIGNSKTSKEYLCKITNLYEDSIICDIIKKIETNVEPKVKVTIFQGLPKADKMELVIQKSVELGVFDIVPIEMKRSIVKLNEKDKAKKIQRWQKISEVAAKQSGRAIIPKINDIINVQKICDLCQEYDIVLVAYENEKENKIKHELQKIKANNKNNLKIAVLVGPEGGIDETEIELLEQNGAKVVTLGNRILRTETVALNILSIIMYEFEE